MWMQNYNWSIKKTLNIDVVSCVVSYPLSNTLKYWVFIIAINSSKIFRQPADIYLANFLQITPWLPPGKYW